MSQSEKILFSDAHIASTGIVTLLWNGLHFLTIAGFQLLVIWRASAVLGENYGKFAYLYAAASVALAFTLIGLHGTLMRHLSMQVSSGAYSVALRTLLFCAGLRIGLLLVVGLGLWGYLRSRPDPISAQIVANVCVFFLMQGLLLLGHAALQGLRRYAFLAGASLCLFLGLLVPADDLVSLFQTLWVGYGCSLLFVVMALYWYFRDRISVVGNDEIEFVIRDLGLFSFVLSIASLCTLASDNLPILLTQKAYSPVVYSCMGLALNLFLYPARINAFTEAFVIPQFSAIIQIVDIQHVKKRFHAWTKLLHLVGPLVVLPVLLFIKPVVHHFFAPELLLTARLLLLLLPAVIARMMLPISMAVFVATGKTGRFSIINGIKLSLDFAIVLLLRGQSPEWLVVALVGNWLVYINMLYAQARLELKEPFALDWVTVSVVAGVTGMVWVEGHFFFLVLAWVMILVIGIVRAKTLIAKVN